MNQYIHRKGDIFSLSKGSYHISKGIFCSQRIYNDSWVNHNLYVSGDYYNASGEGCDPYRLLPLTDVTIVKVDEIPVTQLLKQLGYLEDLVYILNTPIKTPSKENRIYLFLNWLKNRGADGLLTQEQIGNFCSCSRIYVCRQMQTLKKIGLIEG